MIKTHVVVAVAHALVAHALASVLVFTHAAGRFTYSRSI